MSDNKPLKKAIDQLLRAYGYQNQLDEIEIIKIYQGLDGNIFVKHTQKIYFKNKNLHIKLDSAALKQELSYIKEGFVLKLNQKIGRKVIENIVVL